MNVKGGAKFGKSRHKSQALPYKGLNFDFDLKESLHGWLSFILRGPYFIENVTKMLIYLQALLKCGLTSFCTTEPISTQINPSDNEKASF